MATLTDLFTALNNIAQNLGRLIAQTALQVVVPITQGGTGAVTASGARNNLEIFTGSPIVDHLAAFSSANQLQDGGVGGAYLVGSLIGADMNITTDQGIAIALPPGAANYYLIDVVASNASISLTTAQGGIYTGAGKTGVQMVPSTQSYSALTITGPNTAGSLLRLTTTTNVLLTVPILYFSLTTPQGAAATADLRVFARALF